MKLIVAVDENFGIGYKGKLLYRLPEDMKNFAKITKKAGTVIMGRKTLESIGNLLEGRQNLILATKKINYKLIPDEDELYNTSTDYSVFESVEDLMKFVIDNNLLSSSCVIGGGAIYKELLPYCDSAVITKIHSKVEKVDTYFPNLNELPNWELLSKSDIKHYNTINYSFEEYINYSPVKFDR